MVAGDFNDDGWPDLYVGVSLAPNRLFLNDGQGGFRDATTDEIGDPGAAFGVAVGDIDNDGDLDIFQAAGARGAREDDAFRSVMLLNLGDGLFLDITEGVGLSALVANQIQDPNLVDIDNDGDLDLVVAGSLGPPYLYLNNGDGSFIDGTSSFVTDRGWYLSFGDSDGDGFLDMMYSKTPRGGAYYRNNGNDNHWLRVELVGVESNRNGIGARLLASSGALRQMRDIMGGNGRTQKEPVAYLGLGSHQQVDRLEIRWPSGQVDVLHDIPADQKIRVIEGRGTYHVVEPAVWEHQHPLPDTSVVGATLEVSATVRPALFEPGAAITRVAADLSRLGGLSEVPLEDLGDGTYQLETTLKVDSPRRWGDVSIAIEQTTFLGPYWTRLSKSILLPPPEDLVISGDGLVDGWTMTTSPLLDLNPAAETLVYQGETALELRPERSWRVEYGATEPLDLPGYVSLRFAFHPGDATGTFFTVVVQEKGTPPFNLFRIDLLSNDLEGFDVDLEIENWQVVEIPLATFERRGSQGEILKLEGPIERIRFEGDLQGTFYLDDIRLVTAAHSLESTAVLEEHTATLPQTLALSQNYPNPFNSGTVIRFALPTSAPIELALYNLTGQKVATLVEGVREAGTYTVRWDGRDAQGRMLASGVYLYRLQTDQGRVETRKLVLLR
jgi:hypothetical protein